MAQSSRFLRQDSRVRWSASRAQLILSEQRGVFDEATELLFAHMVVQAVRRFEVGERLVFHFQAFEPDDPQAGVTGFPNLILFQPHGLDENDFCGVILVTDPTVGWERMISENRWAEGLSSRVFVSGFMWASPKVAL
jgi:hypothetical protein